MRRLGCVVAAIAVATFGLGCAPPKVHSYPNVIGDIRRSEKVKSFEIHEEASRSLWSADRKITIQAVRE